MDPIGALASILQISKNAYALGNYIYHVYEGAKVIDESVRSLADEVNVLADSCRLVHDELRTVLTTSPTGTKESRYDKDGTLARCVDQQVVQCDSTLKELGRVTTALWPKNGTLWQRASKQIDLQNSWKQTDEIRKRIRSHTDALHTILLVANIRVSHIAPDHATQELPGKLDDLQRSLTTIESKLDGAQRRRSSTGDGDTTLVDFARDTLKSGKTLYEASMAGSVRGTDSVIGEEQAVVQTGIVARWVSTVNEIRRASREVHSSDKELLSGFSDDERDTTPTASTSGRGLQLPKVVEDDSYDSDDEEVELAQVALLEGNRAFDAERWEHAAKILHTLLKLLHKLPHKHKSQQDISGLQYRLAVCSYHIGEVDHAEAGLESLLQHEPISDKEGVQLCDARHLLSRIYVESNKLELAKDACEGTLKARSRLLGKQHQARFESMALMSRICHLLQDDILSELYASRIPDAHRDDLLVAVATLQPKGSLRTSGTVLITPESDAGLCATSRSRGAEVSPRSIPSQYDPGIGRPLPNPSPDVSPLSASPKTHEGGITGPLKDTTIIADAQTKSSSAATGPHCNVPSTTARSSNHPKASQTTAWIDGDTLTADGLPVRPSNLSPASTGTSVPTQSNRRNMSTSTRAQSITSLDEAEEETYPPLRKTGPGVSVTFVGPMSRSERHKIVAGFKIEPKCMHNLDQSICDGNLERSLALVGALLSSSAQKGSHASPIVFNQWTDGLRLATKSPALHLAVLFGDDTLVEPLIKNGFSPNFAYQLSDDPAMRDYSTPLDLAIASRNEPILRVLMVNGAVLEPSNGDSPCRQLLAHASLQMWPPPGYREIQSLLELLLSHGWPVNKGFVRHHKLSATPTFLHQACSISYNLHDYRLPLVNFLIEQADTALSSVLSSETPLHHAIRRDDLEVVNALLQAQATFRLRDSLEKKNTHGVQPLYLAVQRATADHALPLDIIRSLLNRRSNLDELHTQSESRRLRPSKKTHSTARSIAMESGRQDLITLVQGVADNQVLKPLTRARTVF